MNNHSTRLPVEAQGTPEGVTLLRACGLHEAALGALAREAKRLGTHPVDLALGEGVLDETRWLDVLAGRIGASVSLAPPAPQGRLNAEEGFALRGYALPDGTRILAPNGTQAERLLQHVPALHAGRLVLTTRQALLDVLLAHDGARLARKSAYDLPEALSARRWGGWLEQWRRRIFGVGLLVVLAWAALLYLAPLPMLVVPPLILSPLFLMAGLAVLTSTLESTRSPRAVPPRERSALPRYCVMVPLSREVRIVPALVKRLSALLYPRDRLDILFLVEADDLETAQALHAERLPASMLVMRLPPGDPRTKPRAMNLALPFARGELVVAYDAEDAPEPDQLLRAAALFDALPSKVACLQGRLAITNHRDGFLTRRFAVDYAALFDCIKAGMGRAAWPVPLGGTSNHFRTALLHRVGGWDAWNVTEDADLGLRLARFGYLVEDLPSTTWEEAPNRLGAWMNQRTRWMKGWMQTLLVHLSTPRQAVAQLGLFRVAMIGSMGLSVILGALLYPLFLAGVIARLVNPLPLGASPGLLALADAVLVLAIGVSLLVESVPAAIALFRRRALHLLLMVPLAPITYIMVSAATWRALNDLLRRPYFWHKTEHGLARTGGGLASLRNTRKKRRA